MTIDNVRENPFEMAGLGIPESPDVFEKDTPDRGKIVALATRRRPFDRLPVNSFFREPPKASPYHTRRAEDARQRAEEEVPDRLTHARNDLLAAGMRRRNADYADVADHNTMTLAYAQAYAECGLSVVDSHALNPRTGEGTGLAGGEPSAKIPRGAKWGLRASNDPEQITAFWTGEGEYPETKEGHAYPYAHIGAPRNVSITFPAGCGLFVVDEDGEEGMEAVRRLEVENGPLPKTAESISGSGVGRHRIFRCKRPILNTGSKLAPKVDIRGEGGQIIAAPSIHASGGFYRWKDGCAPWDGIADAPDWLEELAFNVSANNAPKPIRPSTRSSSGTGYTTVGFEAHLAVIGDGDDCEGFDAPIYRAACSWWSINPKGSAADLLEVLRGAILEAPCADDRAELRYATDGYLVNRIEQARCYIEANREEDEDAREPDKADAYVSEARAYFRQYGIEADIGPLLTQLGTDAAASIEEARATVARQMQGREADKAADPVAAEKAVLKSAAPTPRILAPLHDERLVDGKGFLIKPDEEPAIYKHYGIKPDDEHAYKRMRLEVRDQMTRNLMDRFEFVVIDGDAKLAIRQGPGEPVRIWKEATLANIYKNRAASYEEIGDKGRVKICQIKPADLFLYARDRDTFVDTCFEPDPVKAASAAQRGEYNIWTGFAVEPVEGDWSKLRGHIHDNICGGNDEYFNWFMTWLASMFARPGVKVPSTIAVLGEQGTGKSKVFDWVRKAIGCAALKVSSGRHLTGNFNAHLDGKIFLTCEEAFWAGDKTAGGVMKDLISSTTLQIEGKFANLVERNNYVNMVFISNNDWAVPVDGEDARRFFVLRVSNARKEDAKFFGEIDDQMENDGIEAMVFELMNWNPADVGLTWESLRTPPKTDELKSQVAQGLEGPMAHLAHILEEGVLSGRDEGGDVFHYDLSGDNPTRVVRTHLTAAMKVENGRGNKVAEARKAIEALLGEDAWHESKAVVTYYGEMNEGSRVDKTTTERVRYLDIPTLDDLTETLARYGRGQ